MESQLQARKKEIERRRKERRKKRRKILMRRLAVFFSICAVIVLVVLSLTVFFPVKTIVVEGDSPYSAEEIAKASKISAGQNVFMAGNDAQANITTELPYISSVKIKRSFPSKITISVTKNKAEVCYQDGQNFYLCDKAGKILEARTQSPENMLLIIGCEAEEPKAGTTIKFKNSEKSELAQKIQKIMAEGSVNVNTINVTDPLDVYLVVDERFTVALGSSANTEEKTSQLIQMIAKIDSGLKGKIDLSYWTSDNPRGIFTQE